MISWTFQNLWYHSQYHHIMISYMISYSARFQMLRVSKSFFKSVALSQKEELRYRFSPWRERPAYGLGEKTGDSQKNAQSVNRNARPLLPECQHQQQKELSSRRQPAWRLVSAGLDSEDIKRFGAPMPLGQKCRKTTPFGTEPANQRQSLACKSQRSDHWATNADRTYEYVKHCGLSSWIAKKENSTQKPCCRALLCCLPTLAHNALEWRYVLKTLMNCVGKTLIYQ